MLQAIPFTRVGRVLAVLVVAFVATTIATVSTSRHALAYSCVEYNSVDLNDGSSAATVHVGRGCGDGLSHVYGTVSDVNCDNRSARLDIGFYNGGRNWWDLYRNERVIDGNGCHTYVTFSYSSTNAWPQIWVKAWAGGGYGQSSGDESWV